MKVRRFSATKIMNTKLGLGFDRNRKYDTDLDRLGRINTGMGEMRKTAQLGSELNKVRKELKGYGI
jgi:hypothetical protein